MRSLVISISIIITALGITTLCALWSCSVIDSITADVESLSLDSGNIERVMQSWSKAKQIFSVTSQRSYIREIDLALKNLEAAVAVRDETQFASSKSTLIYNMKELRCAQAFDLKSVL